MYPHERSLVKEYAGRPFALLGVNSDKDREMTQGVIKEKELNWRSFWNGGSTSGPISSAWNVRSWPTIYLIDHEGVVPKKNVHGNELYAAIAELVKRAEAAGAK